MRTIALLAALSLIADIVPTAVRAADPASYARKDTWHESLIASREALLKAEAEAARKAQKKTGEAPEEKPFTLGIWYAIGPFYAPGNKKNFAFAFPPEKEPSLNTSGANTEDTKAALEKAHGKLRWRAEPDYRDGVPQRMSAGTNGSTYLYRTITATAAKKITGYFGSDDGMRAWLNGKVIISHDVPRGYGPNQDKAELDFQAGTNHLLLKIHNNSGGHGFYFHTDPKPISGRSAPTPLSSSATSRNASPLPLAL